MIHFRIAFDQLILRVILALAKYIGRRSPLDIIIVAWAGNKRPIIQYGSITLINLKQLYGGLGNQIQAITRKSGGKK